MWDKNVPVLLQYGEAIHKLHWVHGVKQKLEFSGLLILCLKSGTGYLENMDLESTIAHCKKSFKNSGSGSREMKNAHPVPE